jgi:hypothetical protein
MEDIRFTCRAKASLEVPWRVCGRRPPGVVARQSHGGSWGRSRRSLHAQEGLAEKEESAGVSGHFSVAVAILHCGSDTLAILQVRARTERAGGSIGYHSPRRHRGCNWSAGRKRIRHQGMSSAAAGWCVQCALRMLVVAR